MPKGRLAEDGPIPEDYLGLIEADSADPAVRTALNVRDSDATLILSHGPLAAGSLLTLQEAIRAEKPVLHLDLDQISTASAAGTAPPLARHDSTRHPQRGWPAGIRGPSDCVRHRGGAWGGPARNTQPVARCLVMELDQLWEVADRARNSAKVSQEDSGFVRRELPELLSDFPHLKLPKRISHPAGFAVTGASIGTFVRCASLIAAKRVLGARYKGFRLLRVHREGSRFENHAIALPPWLSEGHPLLCVLHTCGVSGAGARRCAVFQRSWTGERCTRDHRRKGMEVL